MTIVFTHMMLSFLPKKCAFYLKKKKNAILCLFLKNISPSKRLVCFILNNSHFILVEFIAFYALYKSRILIILSETGDFSLFTRQPNEIKKSRLVSLFNFEVIFLHCFVE